jgi:hypothetical protein
VKYVQKGMSVKVSENECDNKYGTCLLYSPAGKQPDIINQTTAVWFFFTVDSAKIQRRSIPAQYISW